QAGSGAPQPFGGGSSESLKSAGKTLQGARYVSSSGAGVPSSTWRSFPPRCPLDLENDIGNRVVLGVTAVGGLAIANRSPGQDERRLAPRTAQALERH